MYIPKTQVDGGISSSGGGGGGGTVAFTNYVTEINAFLNGINEVSQYTTNSTVDVVESKTELSTNWQETEPHRYQRRQMLMC